ncbi:MAG: bifunctional 2-polyprenyl-6-hydroxyphenol methylase/3-demethylubiquinol 3-O-methyltransferase UbiG [Micromonosporaceae bacterium]
MSAAHAPRRLRPRNDLGLYDDLAAEWWRPSGAFAMLHWLAAARAALIPPAEREGAVLVDLGCGGGLLAAPVAGKGYRHIGVDLVRSALLTAAEHDVIPIQSDVNAVPLADGCADVVSAGELLEHVPDPARVLAEACRLLRPGGLLVLDTIARTPLARFVAVTVAERVPGGAPKGIHDPKLFVPPSLVVEECARHGVAMSVRGIRPQARGFARWLVRRDGAVPMVPTFSTAILYQGSGRKQASS